MCGDQVRIVPQLQAQQLLSLREQQAARQGGQRLAG
jgi:hypothetical protein